MLIVDTHRRVAGGAGGQLKGGMEPAASGVELPAATHAALAYMLDCLGGGTNMALLGPAAVPCWLLRKFNLMWGLASRGALAGVALYARGRPAQ